MNRQTFGITAIIRPDDDSDAESLSVHWFPVENIKMNNIDNFYKYFLKDYLLQRSVPGLGRKYP